VLGEVHQQTVGLASTTIAFIQYLENGRGLKEGYLTAWLWSPRCLNPGAWTQLKEWCKTLWGNTPIDWVLGIN
jgi:hypothetical protein